MPGPLIVAVDFDGTIVEHDYPEIGKPLPLALETMRDLVERFDARVILWTVRGGRELREAVLFLEEHGVRLFGVNQNPETPWTDSPKAYAHVYVDDAAFGCPLVATTGTRRAVDWVEVRPLLLEEARKRACGELSQW